MVAQAYYPSTWEAEAGGSWVSGRPGLHRETPSQEVNKQMSFWSPGGVGQIYICLPQLSVPGTLHMCYLI
jgi:hypothetical protein